MAVLPIVYFPHPTLTTPTRVVESFDETLHRFIDDMAETMYAANGIGLAANQVDDLRRVTVMDCSRDEDTSELLELVNPTIIEREGSLTWEEGCLSFPELFIDVKRAEKVRVRFQDRHGETHERDAEDLFAICLQHEIDHLDGIVFTERIGPLNRRMALKKFERIMKRREEEEADA